MKKYFLSGFALLLPLALTLIIIVFILNLLTSPFVTTLNHFFSTYHGVGGKYLAHLSPKTLTYVSKIIILIALFFFTLIIGVFARWFFLKFLIQLADRFLEKLPVVNKIYNTSKDIIKTIFSPSTEAFKEVVIAPFPEPGKYSLGLISGSAPKACQAHSQEKLVSVLIPTAPHPISGYILLYREEDIKKVPMSIEDAVKFTVSCGIIHPTGPYSPTPKEETKSS